MKVVEKIVYIDNDMRGLYAIILKSIVNFFMGNSKRRETNGDLSYKNFIKKIVCKIDTKYINFFFL